MNESFSELEDRLRRVLPASPDHLTEDTFYQAGWQAAVSSMSGNSAPRTSGVRVFASGLACGLAAAVVGMVAWKLQERLVQTNVVAEALILPSGAIAEQRPTSSSEAALQTVELTEVRAAGHRPLLTSPLLPWNWAASGNWSLPGDWTQPVQQDRRTREEQQILSAASRVQWSCLLMEEGNPSGASDVTQPVVSGDSESTPLRAFSGATSEELF